ncbi:hypothetical protein RJ639_000884, partial [Escallonia herrerae]
KVYAMDITGAIPEELWNLTYLTNINLGQNYLTGTLPASIGNLIRIQYLSLGINALSGELPGELGNLTDLRSLGFGTNNFSGSLPRELGNLRKLEQLYFDSSGVSGGIPSTFANLQSLTTVWASDNELTGSIPAFIGNWSKLTSLRISDLSNRSSSLVFLNDMKLLSVLILRNLNLSGSIPTNIGEYQSLSQLDLSFNNLTGQIPDSLFNLSSLAFLSLGNNKLNGTLPAEKSASLVSIDLSYNELSGTFPSWVDEENLQLNLVANNFTVQGSNSKCQYIHVPMCFFKVLNLEQYVLTPNLLLSTDSRFAIKCGGPQITSSGQIVYERDNETLGPATYLVNTAQRWAVSNVGLPSGSSNPEYKVFSSSQFTNTLDSELFQTARTSAGSLRYYGLGLDNGNYTVLLQFAEMPTQNSNSWRSLGRRVFDIYIQGNLMFKDFNIRREAGGAFLRAVTEEYNVQVTENYLEIHLFWAGKGTCCVPLQGTYGPLISAISATSAFNSTVSNNPPTKKKNRTGLIVGIVVAVAVLGFLSMFVVYYYTQKRKRPPTYEDEGKEGKLHVPPMSSFEDFLAPTLTPSHPVTWILACNKGQLNTISSIEGTLDDGRVVAVKQLSVASHQGKSQFVAEIATISAVQHRNLVKLYGCCIEGDKRLLVYEYLENKSLDQALFGTGLACLQAYEYKLKILLHKEISRRSSTLTCLKVGWESGDLSAWNLHENNHEIELVDATLSEFSEQEVKRVIGVALLCTQTSPALRPSMSRVVAMLSGDIEVPTVTTRPGYLTDWKFNDTTSFMGSETTTRSDNSHYILSTSTSTVDPDYTPEDPSKRILQEIVGDGR